jgi:glycosyltransferase involved in cell wall biosynthesis
MPAVSVVVPVYNKQRTVRRALRSVLAQTFQDFELVVVDDGSTDGSLGQVEGLDSRIQIVRQANFGPGVARNRGVEGTTAPLVAFLDADDAWRPGYLAAANKALTEHPEAAGFAAAYDAGEMRHVQTARLLETIAASGVHRMPPDAHPRQVKDRVDSASVTCLTLRREIFNRYGGFFSREKSLYGEDTYLIAPVVISEPFYYSRELLVDVHFEDSELGFAMRGRHPMHPALAHPELRRNVPAAGRRALDGLLALYRHRYTQRLAREGNWSEIARLRRAFPWPLGTGRPFWKAERKIELRCAVRHCRAVLAPSGRLAEVVLPSE